MGFVKSWEINITKKFLIILIFLITLLSKRNFSKYNMSLFKNIKNIYLDSLEDSSEVLVNVGMQLLLLVELCLQKSV